MIKSFKYAVLLLIVMAALGACSGASQAVPTAEKASVKYQLGWVFDYSAAGFYAAAANGHYAEENLDVTLNVGGFGDSGFIEPIDTVLSGDADFGASSTTGLLQAKADGKPIVAIATITQRSPYAVIALPDSGITTPQDLVGKTVAINDGGGRLLYDAFLASQNVDPASVNTISRTSFGVDPLVNHEVDAIGGWIINEGVALQSQGLQPHYLLLSDYGIDSYDFVIFTTEDTVAKRPDIVERFLRATLKGHQDVVDSPEKAADLTLTYDSTLVKADQLSSLQALIPLINTTGSHIGAMSADIWDFNYKLLEDGGSLSKPFDVKTVYTTTFIDKIYAK